MTTIRYHYVTDEITGSTLAVTADGKIDVNEITSIGSISYMALPEGGATEETLGSINDKVATETTLGSINSKDFATETTLDSVKGTIGSISDKVATEDTLGSLESKDFATETTLDLLKGISGSISNKVATEITLGSINEKDFSTETTLVEVKGYAGSIYDRQADKTQYTQITNGSVDLRMNGSGELYIVTGSFPLDTHITDSVTGIHANVDNSGRLSVTSASNIPPNSTQVSIGSVYLPAKNGGIVDIQYLIPIGSTLTLYDFSGGTALTNASVKLFYDPTTSGSLTGTRELIRVAYLNINNFSFDLTNEYIGTGSNAIVIRLRNNTSLDGIEAAGFVSGYYI